MDFIKGRNLWLKTISNFIEKNIDKCDIDKLFICEEGKYESNRIGEASISKCIIKNEIIDDELYIKTDMNIKPKGNNLEEINIYKRLIGDISNGCIIKCCYSIPYDGVKTIISGKNKYTYYTIEFDNRFEVEHQIYKYVVPIITKHSPYIINSFGVYSCEKSDKLQNMIFESNKYNSIKLLLLEKSSGKKLLEYLSESNQYEKTILFQLFWTLLVMKRLKVKHNDLHFENILIDELTEPITLYFKFNNKYVKLVTKIFLRIVDFDRAVAQEYNDVDFNFLLNYEYCRFGQCEDEFMMMDFCSVISALNHLNKTKKISLSDDCIKFVEKYFNMIGGERKFNRNFVLFFANNKKDRNDIDNKGEDIYKEIFEDLLNGDMRSSEIENVQIEENKDIIIYELPEEKVISFTPTSEYIDTENDGKEKYKNEIIKYYCMMNGSVSNSLLSKIISYNTIDKALELEKKLIDKGFTYDCQESVIGNILILLCCKSYYKIISSKNIPDMKEKMHKALSHSLQISDKTFMKHINRIWTIFGGKLPIEL